MNYFERVFQELWPQIKEQILNRTYVLQKSRFEQNYHWVFVELFFPRSLHAFDFLFYMQEYNI